MTPWCRRREVPAVRVGDVQPEKWRKEGMDPRWSGIGGGGDPRFGASFLSLAGMFMHEVFLFVGAKIRSYDRRVLRHALHHDLIELFERGVSHQYGDMITPGKYIHRG